MACYYPVKGYRSQSGAFTFSARGAISPLVVPCGGCVGCRLKRAGEWAVRGTHEASLYSDNCFITLTYDDKRLPPRPDGVAPANVSLYYEDFQLFMKRLRDRFGSGIRFIMCGEYGALRARPHFHAILFNFDFPDKFFWYQSKQGHKVYRSKELELLWPYGNSDIGSVTPQSIGYVSRYVMKKVTGKAADSFYDWQDPDTGEVFSRPAEFAHYSLKPGIGFDWFQKFHSSVYPHDYVVFNGRKVRPPRYYDKLFVQMTGKPVERVEFFNNPALGIADISSVIVSDDFEAIKQTRIESMANFLDDNTPDRLFVREKVAIARLSSLKRKL